MNLERTAQLKNPETEVKSERRRYPATYSNLGRGQNVAKNICVQRVCCKERQQACISQSLPNGAVHTFIPPLLSRIF